MRCLYTLLLAFVCTISLAANPSSTQSLDADRLSAVEDSVRELQLGDERNSLYLKIIEDRVDNLVELQERTSEDLSNELNTSNRTISLFTLLFTVAAVFLSIYVAGMERKIKKMKEAVDGKKKEVQELVEMINGNIDGLYERIHRADTVSLLKRLIQVPRDIANIEARLLYEKLDESDFFLLKSAYGKLVEEGYEDAYVGDLPVTFGVKFCQQFFQHFLGNAVVDPTLREKIIDFFPTGIEFSFTNDIEKSTRDLGVALADKSLSIDRASILFEYRKALAFSKYHNRKSLTDMLRSAIRDDVMWNEVETRLTEYLTSPGIRPSPPPRRIKK